ncbi:MAG: multidrug efflux pump subunit AcrB, partial [Myxococcota bacterium]
MSNDNEPSGLISSGPIAWMAQNPVAANLLMLILIIGGIGTVPLLKQEVFPEFTLDVVAVSVPYPGASPEEVEQGIVLAVEEAVRGIDGVKRVSSASAEGVGSVSAELLIDADPDRVLADIKTEVDRIRTFPLDAEEPSVTILSRKQPVVSILLAADVDMQSLQEVAERARSQLLDSPDVTQVDIMGVRPLEISIEVPQATLESLGMTLDEIGRQVAASSLELPGGSLKTESGELLVRVSDRLRRGHEFEELVVRSTRDGSEIRLGDIATVIDGYTDTDLAYSLNGRPALRIQAYRVGDETPTAVATAVRALADQLRTELPDTVEVTVWDDDSVLLAERIDLLVRNAALGLFLVLGVLAAFLELRLAFWVALGIPISFLGTMLIMPTTDISINMISLFAFIITLGMVVDDAIIIGENIHETGLDGRSKLEAAIAGAQQMAVPVSFSILTTIAAFAPMLFVPGVSGKLFRILPIIVICVLAFSILESFFVLPAHLAHDIPVPAFLRRITAPILRPVEAGQAVVARGLRWFTANLYRPVLERSLQYRYVTAAVGLSAFIGSVGLLASGVVPFSFFPQLEGNLVTVSARLPYGVAVSRTESVRDEVERAGWRAIDGLDGREAVSGMFTLLGSGPAAGGPGGGSRDAGGHLVTVEMELVPGPERDFTAMELTRLWQDQMPALAGLESISFTSAVGPAAGAAVDIQLAHVDPGVLEKASGATAETLRTFASLTNVN